MIDRFLALVRRLYPGRDSVGLHEPRISDRDKAYVLDSLESGYVSSIGEYVSQFEEAFARFCGAKYAVATSSGTAALHIALLTANVSRGHEVLTQSLTFVATANAIRYCGAYPVFIDVEANQLTLCPNALEDYLTRNTKIDAAGRLLNNTTGRVISAVLPVHTFGQTGSIKRISEICIKFNLQLIEDAAEAVGSYNNGVHAGNYGALSAFSFNGNKIMTTGGGGMVITNSEKLARRARHLSTTARLADRWKFVHDEVGFNYRLPNINAALGLAQLEDISNSIEGKRKLASFYQEWAKREGIEIVSDSSDSCSNYWLNTLVLADQQTRNAFLEATNSRGIECRPAWEPMHTLDMNRDCHHHGLPVTEWMASRIVNVPSGLKGLVVEN